MRVARLMIEGHCVVYPRANTSTNTLNGRFDDAVRAALVVDRPVPIMIEADFTLEVASHRLTVGRIRLFHTQTEIRDKADLLTALQTGRGAGFVKRKALLTSGGDGASQRLSIVDNVAGVTLQYHNDGTEGVNTNRNASCGRCTAEPASRCFATASCSADLAHGHHRM